MIGRAEQAVVLDMKGVTSCDSAGLNMLRGARREADRCEVAWALACVPGAVRRVLETTGADQVLRVYATVADAETALSRCQQRAGTASRCGGGSGECGCPARGHGPGGGRCGRTPLCSA
ncbi:STAS domain-containing protein [Streptomyces mexicanus]|uniref:STAS domain-containing protein n=1 Tax=Streptomyces mexicanus TaxID=178566 RepID=UPI00367571CF